MDENLGVPQNVTLRLATLVMTTRGATGRYLRHTTSHGTTSTSTTLKGRVNERHPGPLRVWNGSKSKWSFTLTVVFGKDGESQRTLLGHFSTDSVVNQTLSWKVVVNSVFHVTQE